MAETVATPGGEENNPDILKQIRERREAEAKTRADEEQRAATESQAQTKEILDRIRERLTPQTENNSEEPSVLAQIREKRLNQDSSEITPPTEQAPQIEAEIREKLRNELREQLEREQSERVEKQAKNMQSHLLEHLNTEPKRVMNQDFLRSNLDGGPKQKNMWGDIPAHRFEAILGNVRQQLVESGRFLGLWRLNNERPTKLDERELAKGDRIAANGVAELRNLFVQLAQKITDENTFDDGFEKSSQIRDQIDGRSDIRDTHIDFSTRREYTAYIDEYAKAFQSPDFISENCTLTREELLAHPWLLKPVATILSNRTMRKLSSEEYYLPKTLSVLRQFPVDLISALRNNPQVKEIYADVRRQVQEFSPEKQQRVEKILTPEMARVLGIDTETLQREAEEKQRALDAREANNRFRTKFGLEPIND